MEETRNKIQLGTKELTETMESIQKGNLVTEESLNKLWDNIEKKTEVKEKSKVKTN